MRVCKIPGRQRSVQQAQQNCAPLPLGVMVTSQKERAGPGLGAELSVPEDGLQRDVTLWLLTIFSSANSTEGVLGLRCPALLSAVVVLSLSLLLSVLGSDDTFGLGLVEPSLVKVLKISIPSPSHDNI